MSTDEKSIRGDLEDYLRTTDMSEYFTSIIETCLISMPHNPSLHIMNHLMKTFPEQIPTTVAAALMAHGKQQYDENKSSQDGGGRSINSSSSSMPKNEKSTFSTSSRPTSPLKAVTINEFDEDEDEEQEEDTGPIDSIVLKHMAMASEGGIHVSLGGWFEESEEKKEEDYFEDGDIRGGDVRTRAKLATERLIKIAKARGVKAFILQKHQSAGWRHGRRDAISAPTPSPQKAPDPPDKLGSFFTRVRNDAPFLEILLPALAKCRLCADLTDFQLILLGEACSFHTTSQSDEIVVPSTSNNYNKPLKYHKKKGNDPNDEKEDGEELTEEDDLSSIARESLLIVKSGSLVVQEVIPPPPKYPRYDDNTVFDDTAQRNYQEEEEDAVESGTVIRQISQLEVGESYGEHRLFGPHEIYESKPQPSPSRSDDDFTNDDVENEDEGNYGREYSNNNYGKRNNTTEQVVVSGSSTCEYWRLPRSLLHSLRAKWAKEDEDFKLNVLLNVPGLADCLNELELRKVAALSEQVSFAPGALVVKEGSLIDDLTIITSGFASFTRSGQVLMETVGPGAFWGDLSLVQGSRLCQATVTASTQKILNAYGPIPTVYRPNKIEKMKNVVKAVNPNKVSKEDDNDSVASSVSDTTPALIVLVVKASALERIMGSLIGFIRRHNAADQAKIFSRVVC